MKLLLLLTLFSFNAFSGYVAESKINNCDRVVYTSILDCQNIESETCYKTPEVEKSYCGVYALQDVFTDDLTKPLRNKTQATACEGQEACQTSLESLTCEEEGAEKFINTDYTEVYCSKVTGYEQKFSHKVAVIDQVRFNQREAAKLAYEQEALLEKQITLRMECGNKTIIESSKMNAKKGFTNAQVMALSAQFADIANLLKLGATDSAKELIDASEPNALISQQELDYLSSFLVNCVGQ